MIPINQLLFRSRQFLYHWLRAVDAHSLHAPFSYKFYQQVIQAPVSPCLEPLQEHRRKIFQDRKVIQVLDLGTGKDRKSPRTIGEIVRSSHNPKVARMLFNLVRFSSAQNILELGTNLGLTTQHLALAAPQGRILTMEACPELSNEARKSFQHLGLYHIELVQGSIDSQLLAALKELGTLDLLFLDANHRYEATCKYFETCLKFIHARSVMVIDDIHWSSQMTKAWNEIIQNQKVTLSLDLFQVGILFFDPELKKDHLILEF